MENVLNIKSRKNDNVYHVFDEKIVVTIGAKTKDIALPFDSSKPCYYERFSDVYYINDKLYAIVLVRDSYDVRFEIDEEELVLKGRPIPTY